MGAGDVLGAQASKLSAKVETGPNEDRFEKRHILELLDNLTFLKYSNKIKDRVIQNLPTELAEELLEAIPKSTLNEEVSK